MSLQAFTDSRRRRTGGRAGLPRRSKSTTKSAGTSKPSHFNRALIDEGDAWRLWRRCSQLVEAANANGHTAFQCIKVNGIDAELSVLVGGRGVPGQFWLRVMYSNALVLTGNRHGLLPIEGGMHE